MNSIYLNENLHIVRLNKLLSIYLSLRELVVIIWMKNHSDGQNESYYVYVNCNYINY